MDKVVGIGLLGFGSVGTAVHQVLAEQAFRLVTETGWLPEIRLIGVRDAVKSRPVQPDCLTTDLKSLVESSEVEIVIEVMGGLDPTRDLVKRALANGKPVITANKMLLATHWDELQEFGGTLKFEAAVGAAIPIVDVLSTLAKTQPITKIEGILNGTTNYILTEMEGGCSYADALASAQKLGYAEADPTSDVGGWDAAYKLAILATLATGTTKTVSEISVDGIQSLDSGALELAKDRGQTVKLIARMEANRLSVRTELLRSDDPMAQVRGTWNAVTIEGPYFERLTLQGRGAGGHATASAIVSDLARVLSGFSRAQSPA